MFYKIMYSGYENLGLINTGRRGGPLSDVRCSEHPKNMIIHQKPEFQKFRKCNAASLRLHKVS